MADTEDSKKLNLIERYVKRHVTYLSIPDDFAGVVNPYILIKVYDRHYTVGETITYIDHNGFERIATIHSIDNFEATSESPAKTILNGMIVKHRNR